jgi:mannose-6-phosphate isomerase-like protein (cupin superfamily)
MTTKRSTTEMQKMERRSFLAGVAALPVVLLPEALLGQANGASSRRAVLVPEGEDRLREHHTIGVNTTAFKVLTQDSGGGLFVIQHESLKKGGPPRHLHHDEDEWFYVMEGRYLAEVGTERFELKAGDSLLGPRGVPHAFAYMGEGPGRLLIAFAPANKMEAFFRDNEKGRKAGVYVNDAATYHAYGMELIGPPLAVG